MGTAAGEPVRAVREGLLAVWLPACSIGAALLGEEHLGIADPAGRPLAGVRLHMHAVVEVTSAGCATAHILTACTKHPN
jgi:hypothetical protein